jgi:hypothetical protein
MSPFGFSVGPPEGWREETRRIGDRMSMTIVCRFDHADGCAHTEDGWVCAEDCAVEDMASVGYKKTKDVDSLVAVKKETHRRWLRVEFTVTRFSERRRFYQGRCRASDRYVDHHVWYRGWALTTRGARRMMERAIEADRGAVVGVTQSSTHVSTPLERLLAR